MDSYKKRKDSLETRAEPAVLKNPFFSTVHQNVNKPKSMVVGLFMVLLFYLLVRQI